jgi:hypothetical protein
MVVSKSATAAAVALFEETIQKNIQFYMIEQYYPANLYKNT